MTIIEIVLTKEPTAEQKKSVGYHAPLALKAEDFLAKEKWEKGEAERKERGEHRQERRENRGEGRRDDRERDTRGG